MKSFFVVFNIAILGGAIGAFLLCQPSKSNWLSAIENQGFESPSLTSTPFFTAPTQCGRDVYAQNFNATIGGRSVSGTACSGIFKGVSIRTR